MGNTVTYLKKQMFTEPTLYQQLLSEIDSVLSTSTTCDQLLALTSFRNQIVEEYAQNKDFLNIFQRPRVSNASSAALMSSWFTGKYSTLTALSAHKVFANFPQANELKLIINEYFTQMYAKDYLMCIEAFKGHDPANIDWSELKSIIASENCFELLDSKREDCQKQLAAFREKNPNEQALLEKINVLFEFLGKKVTVNQIIAPTYEVIGRRWME